MMQFPKLVLFVALTCTGVCFAQTSWIIQNAGTNAILQSVYFVDRNNGWISGAGPILHTTNGGTTWTAQTTPTLAGF